jgi:uncharacterized protein YjbI with pentapeptide repeats
VIVTFYSYKGGVGRSMALVNVGEILADIGYDVVLCDFDLEAPGLEQYVTDAREDVAGLRARPGVVDLLEEYKDLLADPAGPDSEPPGAASDFKDINGLPLRRPASYAVPIRSQNPNRLGRLRLLGAGARDEERAMRYSESVRGFDWPDFYDRWAGAAYLDFFREDLTTGQSIVLIDSRTGVTEHGGVCTHHLADLVVLVSAPNDLNIEGTRWMANLLATADLAALRQGRPLQVLPVAGRVETSSEVVALDAFRKRFVAEFAATVPPAAGNGREFVEATEIPYVAYFAFTEKVVARDTDTTHRELLSAYQSLTQAIVNVGLDAGLLDPPKATSWAGEMQLQRAEQERRSIFDRHRLWLESGHESGERAMLHGRDFSQQELTDVDLSAADLTEANFERANLRGARFVEATMFGAVLRGAQLDRADLSAAILKDAILTGVILPEAKLDAADLTRADLIGADASGASFRGARLGGARLDRANLRGCDLTGTDLTGATLVGTDLGAAVLNAATGLTARELARATVDDATQLPAGLKPGARGSPGPAQADPAADGIVPVSAQRDYPALSEDFRLLDQRLVPELASFNARATAVARSLRSWRGLVVAFAAAAVALAAAFDYPFVFGQMPEPDGIAWAAAAVLGVAALLTGSLLLPAYRRMGERRSALQRAADRLRAEYFLFMGRIGGYADPGQRRKILEERIKTIIQEGPLA